MQIQRNKIMSIRNQKKGETCADNMLSERVMKHEHDNIRKEIFFWQILLYTIYFYLINIFLNNKDKTRSSFVLYYRFCNIIVIRN